jgi:cytochrome c551
MIKVLTAALLGTVVGVILMVAVIAIYGTDTEDSSSVGLGSLPISTFSPSSSAPASSAPSSTPSTGGGGTSSGGASGDVAHGQQLFQEKCSGCHVTEPGAAPTVGPNLADLAPSLTEERILQQIDNPAPPMPPDLVTGQDAKDVAAYVLSLANQ